MKFSFANDYSEGCHPSILEALKETNLIQQIGYGDDEYTSLATELLRQKIKDQEADIHLISGGTLTNLLVLSSIMKPFESVIAANTGHIYVNEAGAIEATGHKVEVAEHKDGKLTIENIKSLLIKSPKYHTVKPKVVYISNSTEIGSIYHKTELKELSDFCKSNNLILYLDGARLASALTAESNDLTMEDIAKYTDVFYLGGTKAGALFGEAVIITNEKLKEDFKYHQKQRGAMLAKGRVLGIQFTKLLQNDLIFQLAHHANNMANRLTNAFVAKGCSFLTQSDTNQIFPILSHSMISKLKEKYEFYVWKQIDNEYSAIRLVTSWATPYQVVDNFVTDINNL